MRLEEVAADRRVFVGDLDRGDVGGQVGEGAAERVALVSVGGDDAFVVQVLAQEEIGLPPVLGGAEIAASGECDSPGFECLVGLNRGRFPGATPLAVPCVVVAGFDPACHGEGLAEVGSTDVGADQGAFELGRHVGVGVQCGHRSSGRSGARSPSHAWMVRRRSRCCQG